jgi:hypothetical protein
VTAREDAIRAHRALLNGGSKLSYFEGRGCSSRPTRKRSRASRWWSSTTPVKSTRRAWTR